MIGIVFDVPGGTQQQYDKAMVELNLAANPAKGLITHSAGPNPNGWSVVDIWESQADFQHFFETRLGAAIQKAGIPEPKITTFSVHNRIA
jgi:heme-degrading monooxygenase HmoA